MVATEKCNFDTLQLGINSPTPCSSAFDFFARTSIDRSITENLVSGRMRAPKRNRPISPMSGADKKLFDEEVKKWPAFTST